MNLWNPFKRAAEPDPSEAARALGRYSVQVRRQAEREKRREFHRTLRAQLALPPHKGLEG
jgi:hypothetical protein